MFSKHTLKSALILLALLAGEPGAFSEESTLVVTNTNVPLDGITGAALKEIYTGRTAYWPNGQKVVIVLLASQDDGALNEASGMGVGQFKTFWRRMVFSGRGGEPKRAENVTELIAQVAANKGAIALVPKGHSLKGLKTLKITGSFELVSGPQDENDVHTAPPP